MTRQAPPEHAPAPAVFDIPRMREANELEEFIPVFETFLRVNDVPKPLWKQKLLTHLPLKALVKVEETLQADDFSYEDTVGALRGSTTMSFFSAAEDLCTGERGKLWELDIRPCSMKIRHLVRTVAQEADTRDEMAESLTVALTRDRLSPALKHYIDTTRRFKFREYLKICEEWERNQPTGTSCFRKAKSNVATQGGRVVSSPYPQKPALKCFSCGKCNP